MTRSEFDAVARAAIKAVSYVEGWDAEHPSWVVKNGVVRPSKTFRLELLETLEGQGISVTGWNSKQKRWAPISNESRLAAAVAYLRKG